MAYSRDALMVQDGRISSLSSGDRICIAVVMKGRLGSVVSANVHNCFCRFARATFAPETVAVEPSL